jgi:hypothetical protein
MCKHIETSTLRALVYPSKALLENKGDTFFKPSNYEAYSTCLARKIFIIVCHKVFRSLGCW